MSGYRSGFVALIGRPNVGKSRLFNRIIRRRYSIVDDTAGITRDRVEFISEGIRWIDTGGIGLDDDFAEAVSLQARIAIEDTQTIITSLGVQGIGGQGGVGGGVGGGGGVGIGTGGFTQ